MSPVSSSSNPDTTTADNPLDSEEHGDQRENKNSDVNSFEETNSKEANNLISSGQDAILNEVVSSDTSHNDAPSYTCMSGDSFRPRTSFTHEQLCQLEKEYKADSYLSRSRKTRLAKFLQLPEYTIQIWFQNRRVKNKRKKNKYSDDFPWNKNWKSLYSNVITEANNKQLIPGADRQPHQLLYHPAPYSYLTYMPFQYNYMWNTQYCNVSQPENIYCNPYMTSENSKVSHLEALQFQISHLEALQSQSSNPSPLLSRFLECCNTCSQGYIHSPMDLRTTQKISKTNAETLSNPIEASLPYAYYGKFQTNVPSSTFSFGMAAPIVFSTQTSQSAHSGFPNTPSTPSPSVSESTVNSTSDKQKFFRPFEDN